MAAREPALLAATAVGAAAFFSLYELVFSNRKTFTSRDGLGLELTAQIAEATFFLAVLMRAWRLTLLVDTNKQKMALHSRRVEADPSSLYAAAVAGGFDSDSEAESESGFQKVSDEERALTSVAMGNAQKAAWTKKTGMRRLLTWYGCIWLALIIVDSAIMFSSADEERGGTGDLVVFAAYGTGYSLAFAYFIYRLRPVQDSFKVAQELYAMVFVCVASRIAIALDIFGGCTLNELTHPSSTIQALCQEVALPSAIMLISSCFTLYYQALQPLRLVWREEKFKADIAKNNPLILNNEHFEELLRDPESRAYFEAFTQNEFSLENLLFYSDVQAFKSTMGMDQRSLARDIASKYLGASSPLRISDLGGNIAEQIVWDVDNGNINQSTFALAEDQIWLRLKADSFARFLMSREYRKLQAMRTDETKTISQVLLDGPNRHRGSSAGVMDALWHRAKSLLNPDIPSPPSTPSGSRPTSPARPRGW